MSATQQVPLVNLDWIPNSLDAMSLILLDGNRVRSADPCILPGMMVAVREDKLHMGGWPHAAPTPLKFVVRIIACVLTLHPDGRAATLKLRGGGYVAVTDLFDSLDGPLDQMADKAVMLGIVGEHLAHRRAHGLLAPSRGDLLHLCTRALKDDPGVAEATVTAAVLRTRDLFPPGEKELMELFVEMLQKQEVDRVHMAPQAPQVPQAPQLQLQRQLGRHVQPQPMQLQRQPQRQAQMQPVQFMLRSRRQHGGAGFRVYCAELHGPDGRRYLASVTFDVHGKRGAVRSHVTVHDDRKSRSSWPFVHPPGTVIACAVIDAVVNLPPHVNWSMDTPGRGLAALVRGRAP